jgi:hypothetical protein
VNNSYANFLKTQPPVFLKADEPLEADDWIRTIEQKLDLIHCTDAQKTKYAAQQLQGPIGAWWSNFGATQQARNQNPWVFFREAFCAHNIPKGRMKIKLEQFIKL